ncbi:hypothetical protein TEA_027364 [Camellia sinensis var. sinensis]|uniref:Uncharacterized protein n=1 Tax=Camellia sinensis var. sinensis TaxID=542762 RepID=A0A4S4EI79_CAMSN|nr:hypothetical protein TEA_027364 [Camellia sinensis var. sinensis]
MIVEDHEMPNGWPLGLGNMNIRLQVTENLQPAAAAPRLSHSPSSSFSSFSSSNLDTEIYQSTASFFPDHSVSLGRLIGIREREGGVLYFPHSNRVEQGESVTESSCLNVPGKQEEEMCRGICVPLFASILVKMNRSKSSSRG